MNFRRHLLDVDEQRPFVVVVDIVLGGPRNQPAGLFRVHRGALVGLRRGLRLARRGLGLAAPFRSPGFERLAEVAEDRGAIREKFLPL